MRAGDLVLKRSIYRGNVRWAFPHRYVGEWHGHIGIYCGPGNQGKGMMRGPDGYLRRWITDAPPYDLTWDRGGVLRFDWVPAATGEPQWKDEDELAEAVDLGVFDERAAAKVRAEGERVIASEPWPTGWEDWRPPPDWAPLELPEDWHVV